MWSSPSVDANSNWKIYVGTDTDRLMALDSRGSLEWSYVTSGNASESSPAIGSDGIIYMGAGDIGTAVYCVFAISTTGSFSWSYQAGSDVFSSPAVSSEEKIYIGSLDKNIYSLNSDGSLAWSYETFDFVRSSPSIGSDGRVYVGSDDNLLYVFDEPLTPTPTTTPTAPTPTPTPPLGIEPGELHAGESFSFEIMLTQDINDPFDFYILAETQFGVYTLYLDGSVEKGIIALYRNVQGFKAPFVATVIPNVILPMTMGRKEVTFSTVAVEAGKMPPVSSLGELTADTPNVIYFDKKTVTVKGVKS